MKNLNSLWLQIAPQDRRRAVIVAACLVGIIGVWLGSSLLRRGSASTSTDHHTATHIDPNYRFRGDYHVLFDDKNDVQLVAAKARGITPLRDVSETERIAQELVPVEPNENFTIRSLTHSIPYLVPHAEQLLQDIAADFATSLAAREMAPHKLVVTSLTRTQSQRASLAKNNANAAEESAHCYGTTLDISWTRYEPVGNETLGDDVLKQVLAAVLYQYQQAGRCYVKHEKKQSCFHITAR